jgi:hypothetical protein
MKRRACLQVTVGLTVRSPLERAALIGLDSVATLDRVIKAAVAHSPATGGQNQDIHGRAQIFAGTGY